MEKVLAQSEIDALFASARQGDTPPALAAGGATEAYNFNRAGQISVEEMRAIAVVNDLFARNLMHTMGAWLRTEFEVALVAGEQMPYMEYVERLSEPTFLCSVRLEPMGAIGLLELEMSLIAPVVDLLLGGTGKADQMRALTDIEELIMVSVLSMIVKALNVAWQPAGLQFAFDKRESASHVAKMMVPGEKTLCSSFEVRMPQAQGAVTLCLPAVVLNTILRRLVAERGRPRRSSGDTRERMFALLGDSVVRATLQFPPVQLRARQLAALRVGSVLRLPVPRHATAELRAGGLPLALARPVRTGEHRGARLESGDNDATTGQPSLGAGVSSSPGEQPGSVEHAA